MPTLVDRLAGYADYHRDRRNILTHLVGIPMIVLAVAILLSRPAVPVGAVALSPALAVALACAVWYLRLDRPLGLVMTVVLAGVVAVGQAIAVQSTAVWAGWGVGLFVVGWIIQFVGHAYEGRKPAFVDDVVGLIVGPLFVAAEIAFMLGWRRELEAAIVARSGPVRTGRLGRA